MDNAAIEREMDALSRKRSRLFAAVADIEREMSALRQKCTHELDDMPNAWWCRHCGGEVKKSV